MSVRRIGCVLLAAGGSTRMGQPKPLLAHGATTFLGHALNELQATGWPVVVVAGRDAALLQPIIAAAGADHAINAAWAEGMASSIRCGLHKLIDEHDVNAALICTCDQPGVTTELFQRLAAQMAMTGKPMAASSYAGTRGIPALFDASCFAALMQLRGDNGAKRLLLERPDECAEVAFAEGAVDIDRPEDYVAWLDSR